MLTLIDVIAVSFDIQMVLSKPDFGAMAPGCFPSPRILHNRDMIYVAISILGATVMPHNLYLHSSIAQTRHYPLTVWGEREAIFLGTIDSTVALLFALFINAAILIVTGASFYGSGHHEVAEIQDAYKLLSPLLGVGVASTLFAVACWPLARNSTLVTATMERAARLSR